MEKQYDGNYYGLNYRGDSVWVIILEFRRRQRQDDQVSLSYIGICLRERKREGRKKRREERKINVHD